MRISKKRGARLLANVINEVAGTDFDASELPPKSAVDQLLEKTKSGKFATVADDFKALYSMVTESIHGRFNLSGQTLSLLIGTIVYVVSPIDLLPEAVLGPVGYLDDAFLVKWLVESIGDDINRFKRHTQVA